MGLSTTAGADADTLQLNGSTAEAAYPHSERIDQAVTVGDFGRYAFEADGEQPVRVQIVDRMTGPGETHSGRTDRFVNKGDVKVVLYGADNGTGDIRLRVHPFAEQHRTELPRLPEKRLVETELRDYQRRSYWIEIEKRRWLSVEVGGRYLADLRLWRDGQWLVDAEPERALLEPVTGEPLEVRRIHTRLEPGLYRLSAYGGPGNPWSTESEAAPLYLRMGVPELPPEGWSVQQASPFGIDRWRLRTKANVFQLELPEARPARLQVAEYGEGASPYRPGRGSEGRIDKDSRDPATIVRADGASRRRPQDMLVAVERAPGTEYRLAYLHHARRYALPETRSAWVGTVSVGDPRDSIDATAIIYNDRPGRDPVVKASSAIELSADKAWRRRFNLLETVDLLVEVEEDGTYAARVAPGSAAKVALRVEPLDRSAARNYRSRWDVGEEARWDLVKGYYRISMRPRHGDAGIAEVSLHHTAAPARSLAAPRLPARQASAVFEGVRLNRHDYVLTNRYNRGRSGLTVRPWPLQLDRPLPVIQSARSVRRFRVDGGGTLIAETPQGRQLTLAASEEGPRQDSLAMRGEATVHVFNDNDRPIRYLLRWQPEPSPPAPPLETISSGRVRDLQADLPLLRPGPAARLELAREQRATYRVAVEDPALYRLETTGLLSTGGRLRTRTITDLATASTNGIGRNFLIQRFLGSGDYRLSVNPNGRSAGPLGLQLRRAPLREAGRLAPGGTVRTTVSPGEAVSYRLKIPETGRYRLAARGLKEAFDIQLEGPDGWPAIRPGHATPATLKLRPGIHRLTVLPQAVAARAVVSLTRTDTATSTLTGHGPHPLPLNRTRRHTWMEPENPDAARTPDRWRFDLPAPMHIRIHRPAKLEARLQRREDQAWRTLDAPAAENPTPWRALEAGAYRLAVRSRRPDNRLDYRIRVETRELPMGQSRRVSVPARIPLALAENRLVKLSSLGAPDVAAALLDADGRRIAFNDDRPDDWNFLISRRLRAGRYTLSLTAPDGGGRTTVAFEAPEEIAGAAQSPDSEITVHDADVHVHPLTLPEADDAPRFGLPLVFASRSDGAHGVALERRTGGTWQVVTTRTGKALRGGLVLTRQDLAADYRLRVWALDPVPDGIRLALRLGAGQARSREDDGRVRWRLSTLAGTDAALGLAVLKRPGPLHLGADSKVLWATPSGAFRQAREGWIPARDGAVWLLAGSATPPVEAEVVTLKPGSVRQLPATSARSLPLRTETSRTDRLHLWIARSTAHSPELRATAATGTGAAATRRTAVTARLPGTEGGDPGLALRLADEDTNGPVTVSAHALPVQSTRAAGAGPMQIRLPAGTATRITAPDGAAHLTMAAPRRVAGILARDGRVERTLWTGRRATQLHAETAADTLWLANPADVPVTIGVTWRSIAGPRELEPGRFHAFRPVADGRLSLSVRTPAGFTGTARAAGDVAGIRFVHPDGRTVHGRNGTGSVRVDGPGILSIEHTGAFGVWLTGNDGDIEGWRHSETLSLEAPALLNLRTNGPDLVSIQRPGQPAELRWVAGGTGNNTLLPTGATRLRAMSGAPAKALLPPEAMPAGLGKPIRLGPGEARAFTFRLEQARTVGLGLKADREVVRGVLVDEHGRRLGKGIVQMHRLQPGRYYLIARLPGGESPVLLRTALVGTQTPDEQPPARIKARYRQLAGEE